MERLKDKVAIITGGAGGIGKATARIFLNEGAWVLLVDKNEKDLKEVEKEMKSPKLAIIAADVSNAEDTEKYIRTCLLKFSRIDIFFMNAGIEGVFSPIAGYPEKEFDRVIAVNLKGVWLGCQLGIPKMTPGGSAIITSSVAGLKGFSGLGAYVASKHGVTGLMRTAALEYADKKIRVNSIHPGPVDNRMMRSIESQISPDEPGDAQQNFTNMVPFKRYAESVEVGELALFLASDESKYITGTTQVIDGGMSIV
ncbi:SDR family NAD(P)-dependent oxidoreductase [Salegentibacter chungangensis]|uniref:SDR family NAD(P)-dependent oxidoreductase n=1 Tax=Salegentibacter chungangensis TaxID=1335724 RepID=A0ABW3NP78_9FLAO